MSVYSCKDAGCYSSGKRQSTFKCNLISLLCHAIPDSASLFIKMSRHLLMLLALMTTYSICVLSQKSYTAWNSGICSGFYLSDCVCFYFEPYYTAPCSWPMNSLKFKRPVVHKFAHFNALIPYSPIPLSHLFQIEDIAAGGIFLTALFCCLYHLLLLPSYIPAFSPAFLALFPRFCILRLLSTILVYTLLWNLRGSWQGGCSRARNLWGCKSSSHLLSNRWCLQRSCLEMTVRGPDPLATCTCFILMHWCLWKTIWGQDGKGARICSPELSRIHWGSLKAPACFWSTPLPSSAAFSGDCIFKQSGLGITKLQLSPPPQQAKQTCLLSLFISQQFYRGIYVYAVTAKTRVPVPKSLFQKVEASQHCLMPWRGFWC